MTIHALELKYKLIIFIIIILVFPMSAKADDEQREHPMAFHGFSGGMMVHSGYLWSKQFTLVDEGGNVAFDGKLKGVPLGLGGAIRLNFGKYLRVGGEGYVTNMSYPKLNNSYSTIGWGGALVDVKYEYKKALFSLGVVVGGGSIKNFMALDNIEEDFYLETGRVSYRKYGFCAVDPYISFEYAMSRKLHLMFKLDYLLNVSNPQADYVQGVRAFIGIMFCHLK